MSEASLLSAFHGLGNVGFLGWLLLGIGLVWLNAKAGLPRARRDLQLRGFGFVVFLIAAVLGLGQGLVSWWPWPPQAALLCAALAPLLAGALGRAGRLGLAVLVGLSFPCFLLIALTAFFGLWLDITAIGGGLLGAALLLSVAGAVLTWRTPRPANPFTAFGGLGGAMGNRFGARFGMGAGFPGGFPGGSPFGRAPGAANDDVVDVEARTIDDAPTALPRQQPPAGTPPRD